MKIICVKSFRDKTTHKIKEKQKIIKVGTVFECDDELAKERIEKGFAKEYVEEKPVKTKEVSKEK